jgi:hypothetical protein
MSTADGIRRQSISQTNAVLDRSCDGMDRDRPPGVACNGRLTRPFRWCVGRWRGGRFTLTGVGRLRAMPGRRADAGETVPLRGRLRRSRPGRASVRACARSAVTGPSRVTPARRSRPAGPSPEGPCHDRDLFTSARARRRPGRPGAHRPRRACARRPYGVESRSDEEEEIMRVLVWVSDFAQPDMVKLDEPEWRKIGTLDGHREVEVWKVVQGYLGLRAGTSRRSAEFYADVDQDNPWYQQLSDKYLDVSRGTGLGGAGDSFWLALELVDAHRLLISVRRATIGPMGRRPPEPHPGLLKPGVPVGFRLVAGDRGIFNSVST